MCDEWYFGKMSILKYINTIWNANLYKRRHHVRPRFVFNLINLVIQHLPTFNCLYKSQGRYFIIIMQHLAIEEGLQCIVAICLRLVYLLAHIPAVLGTSRARWKIRHKAELKPKKMVMVLKRCHSELYMKINCLYITLADYQHLTYSFGKYKKTMRTRGE